MQSHKIGEIVKNEENSLELERENVTVKVLFFEASYRKKPPFGTAYRPHFVVKEATEYLGVQFVNLAEAPFGEEIISEIELPYGGDWL